MKYIWIDEKIIIRCSFSLPEVDTANANGQNVTARFFFLPVAGFHKRYYRSINPSINVWL